VVAGGYSVTTVLAVLVLLVVLAVTVLPGALGYQTLVVLSGSMEPALQVGDLAVVQPTPPDQLAVGDVITYRTPARPGIPVTHRIVSVTRDAQGQLEFQTKGDANNEVDSVAADPSGVVGRVAFGIPKVGYLVDFAKRPEGKLLLFGVPGVLLVLDYLLGRRRQRRAALTVVRSPATELIARGRVALQNGSTHAALALADRAIAADPHADDAWLLKADCLPPGAERIASLQAGLTVNPGSARIRAALDAATAGEAATG
jgi:signal peptidase